MLRKILFAGFFCLIAHAAFAQVVPASHFPTTGRFQIGVGGSGFATDWDRNEYGITAYADVDVYRHLVSIEGETRFLFLNQLKVNTVLGAGSMVNEKNFGAGPRLAIHRGHWTPYVKAIFGVSTISWGHVFYSAPNYTEDSYTYMGTGGGADYRLTKHLRLRGEYQYQLWKGDSTDKNSIVLTPNGFTLAVGYHF